MARVWTTDYATGESGYVDERGPGGATRVTPTLTEPAGPPPQPQPRAGHLGCGCPAGAHGYHRASCPDSRAATPSSSCFGCEWGGGPHDSDCERAPVTITWDSRLGRQTRESVARSGYLEKLEQSVVDEAVRIGERKLKDRLYQFERLKETASVERRRQQRPPGMTYPDGHTPADEAQLIKFLSPEGLARMALRETAYSTKLFTSWPAPQLRKQDFPEDCRKQACEFAEIIDGEAYLCVPRETSVGDRVWRVVWAGLK